LLYPLPSSPRPDGPVGIAEMHRYKTALFSIVTLLFLAGAGEAQAAVPPAPDTLTEVFGIPITNSMITSWVISIGLIVLVRWLIKKPTLVPHRGQALVETIFEGIKGLIEPIVGKHMVKPVFPLLVGLFLFILLHNWSGLLPGVGTIGWGYDRPEGFYITEKLVRPGNTDLNTTLALALIGMVAWLYFIFRYAGPKIIWHDLFGNKASKSETPVAIYYMLIPIFLMVGLIEMISIAFRPVSLSLRLYGNMFGGENLLMSMSDFFAWIVPIPFYFFEFMVSIIQASIFIMLIAIYIGLICNHEGGEGEDAH